MDDLDTVVHDEGEAAILGDMARLFVDDAFLEPEGSGANGDSRPGYFRAGLRPAEYIDDIHMPRDILKTVIAGPAEYLAHFRPYRYHCVSLLEQVAEDNVAGSALTWRSPHDSDHLCPRQQ